jgi:hypothetical protein
MKLRKKKKIDWRRKGWLLVPATAFTPAKARLQSCGETKEEKKSRKNGSEGFSQ